MGNNLSSFLSLDNLNIVETKYWKIYDIPYLSINKKELKLDPKKDDSFAIVHISNATQYEKTVKKIADSLPVKVYVLPSQDSQYSFDKIKYLYPTALGKHVLNGVMMHPLIKFIKRNCFELYSNDTNTAKQIFGIGIFLKQGNVFKYYPYQKIDELIKEIKKPAEAAR